MESIADLEFEIDNIFIEIGSLSPVDKLTIITLLEEKILNLKRNELPVLISDKDRAVASSTNAPNIKEEPSVSAGNNHDEVENGNIDEDLANYHENREIKDIIFKAIKRKKEINSKTFECELCSFTFLHIKSLKKHIENPESCQKSSQTHQCPKCNNKSVSRKALMRHMIKHTDKYKCETCNHAFSRSEYLEDHKKNPLNCKKYLNEAEKEKNTFSNKSNNTKIKDEVNATDVGSQIPKVHQCPQCNFKTDTSSRQLKRHMIIHSEKYKCDTCNHSYQDLRGLQLHQKNPLKCQRYLGLEEEEGGAAILTNNLDSGLKKRKVG